MDIGSEIGARGWRQGCLLHDVDLRELADAEGFDCHEGIVRGALPDGFNDLLAQKRKKWEKIRKKLSGHVSGLFVELNPPGELARDQRYSVNLLALVPVVHKASLGEVQADVQRLKDLMTELGMEVTTAAKAEDDVSYAVVRRMTRFPLEYLSLRGEPFDPLPAEFDN